MLSLVLTSLAAAAGCLLLLNFVQKIFVSSSLSKIPNAHFLAPYSDFWLIWHKYKGTEHRVRHAAHQRFGPVVRLGPKEISINSIEDGVQPAYGNFEKGSWYSSLTNYGLPFLFILTSNQQHKERKRMLSHVYTKSYVQNSVELDHIIHTMLYERMIPQMPSWDTGESIDVYRHAKEFMMDVATAYLYGFSNGTNLIGQSEEKSILHEYEALMPGIFWLADAPSIATIGRWLGFQLPSPEVFIAHEKISEIGLTLADDAKKSYLRSSQENSDSYPTVYGYFRDKLVASKTVPVNQVDMAIAGEMSDHLFAGHKATGIIVTYLMIELARNPKALAKLQEELAPVTEGTSAQVIDRLPYLHALLMETMRLWPGNFGPFPRDVPAEGATLGGFHVPGGTTVSASVYALHRNSDVFPNPEKWLPERWIEANSEGRTEMLKWFWNFGSGPRSCIGIHLANRMMKAFIVGVFKDFEIALVPESSFDQFEGLVGYPKGNRVLLRVIKRNSVKQ